MYIGHLTINKYYYCYYYNWLYKRFGIFSVSFSCDKFCSDNIVLERFMQKIPTTVIWDNNDFREETPSGESTTVSTNGLLVQMIGYVDESMPCINSESKHLPKTKTRSVDHTPNVLRCPTKESDKVRPPSAIRVSYMNTLQINISNKPHIDIAYCLSKLQEVDGHILPGWTGYNTLLNCTTIPPLPKLGYLPVIYANPTRTVYTSKLLILLIVLNLIVWFCHGAGYLFQSTAASVAK